MALVERFQYAAERVAPSIQLAGPQLLHGHAREGDGRAREGPVLAPLVRRAEEGAREAPLLFEQVQEL